MSIEPSNILLKNLIKTYLESRKTLEENTNAELEVKFATKGKNKISKINFDNIIQYLLAHGFTFTNTNNYLLRITSNEIRSEISGLKNIQDYCKTNKIPYENKDGYNFIKKNLFEKSPPSIVNFDDFNFRVTYNIETTMSRQHPDVMDMFSKWDDSKKFYRLINRFTMEHTQYPVNIDLSIVKETDKSINDSNNTIRDSDIFNVNEKYEVEIEINNNKLDNLQESENITDETLSKLLKNISKYVLSGLQESNYPISNSEGNIIINDYLSLIGKPSSSNLISNPKDFIGPSSSTLQIANITEINDNFEGVNIRNNYTVTEKADGERKMLFINEKGKIYLINTLLSVQFTGSISKNEKLFKSLLDGEHVKYNKKGQFINLYAAFDIYFLNGKDMRNLKFLPNENIDTSDEIDINFRLPLLNKFTGALDAKSVNGNPLPTIRIDTKKFYESNKKQSIFAACKKINENIKNGMYEYETDGLIFTPKNLGVGINNSEDKVKSTKATWDYSLKWKPVEFNTVDFLITTKKTTTGAEFIGNLFQKGLNTSSQEQIVQYKTVILRVGFDESKHGYINPCQNIIDNNYPFASKEELREKYKPVQFFPTNPYDPNAGICNIMISLDKNGFKKMFTENNEIIEDNTIVEFRYDINEEENWRWKPLRVRYDKTNEFRKGFKNFGNAYHVAQSNWHSIHNPITIDMLTTGNGIPDTLDDNDIYYNKKTGDNNTKAMRDFHNLFVKNKLITSISNAGNILIDYAVGKGGDLPKWISAKLRFVFGIDLSRDNIENRMDGACARYINYKNRFRVIPDALFIQGDANKNIKKLDAQYSEQGKMITRAIFGEGTNDEKTIGRGVSKSFAIANQGFDISSIQFAVHYMFENASTLNEFLTNVAECTKLGGYFIGTCFDGKKVFNLLADKKQNESFIIMDREKKNKLLEINKQYDKDTFSDDISCLGYTINIFQESINKTFKEYLVNFTYFTSILENYGFVQLTSEEANKIGFSSSVGSFSDMFDLMNTEIKKDSRKKNDYGIAYKMTSQQKQISFLNKYFIFKKIRNVDINDIKTNLTKIDKYEEEKNITKVETELEKVIDESQQSKEGQTINIIKKIKKKSKV
jgi:hypothetical protein